MKYTDVELHMQLPNWDDRIRLCRPTILNLGYMMGIIASLANNSIVDPQATTIMVHQAAASSLWVLLMSSSMTVNAAAFVAPVLQDTFGCSLQHDTRLFMKTPQLNVFDSFWSRTNKPKQKDSASIKNDLLTLCDNKEDDMATKRIQVRSMLDALTAASPISATAASLKLAKKWQVLWTTEKEINIFLDQGWATNIYQVIDNNKGTIENSIPLVNDRGSFVVQGTIVPSNDRRTEFVFTAATWTIAFNLWKNPKQTVQIKLPPVGSGWFDTLYLDDTLRVDINSRNDILVCRPVL
jgi:PAP_fibrillin